MPERGGLNFEFDQERLRAVRWSRGSCGNAGCSDPECVCGLCARPIGVSEDDPRRHTHDENCLGCEICEDDVPIMLIRDEGPLATQAAFHKKCFEKLLINVKRI